MHAAEALEFSDLECSRYPGDAIVIRRTVRDLLKHVGALPRRHRMTRSSSPVPRRVDDDDEVNSDQNSSSDRSRRAIVASDGDSLADTLRQMLALLHVLVERKDRKDRPE